MCWGCFCCLFSLGSHVNVHVTTKGRNPEVCEMNINIVNHAIFPGDHLSTIINILSYYVFLNQLDLGQSLQLLMKLTSIGSACALDNHENYCIFFSLMVKSNALKS